jgi:hypothetical protein
LRRHRFEAYLDEVFDFSAAVEAALIGNLVLEGIRRAVRRIYRALDRLKERLPPL